MDKDFRCGKCNKPISSKYSKCLDCGYLGPHSYDAQPNGPAENDHAPQAPATRRRDSFPAESTEGQKPAGQPQRYSEPMDIPAEPPSRSRGRHDDGDSRFLEGMRSHSPILEHIDNMESNIICQRCRGNNEPNAKTCQKCGARFCPYCHLEIESPDTDICTHCGKKDPSFKPVKYLADDHSAPAVLAMEYSSNRYACPYCGTMVDRTQWKCPLCSILLFPIKTGGMKPIPSEADYPSAPAPAQEFSMQKVCSKCGTPIPAGSSMCPIHGKFGDDSTLSQRVIRKDNTIEDEAYGRMAERGTGAVVEIVDSADPIPQSTRGHATFLPHKVAPIKEPPGCGYNAGIIIAGLFIGGGIGLYLNTSTLSIAASFIIGLMCLFSLLGILAGTKVFGAISLVLVPLALCCILGALDQSFFLFTMLPGTYSFFLRFSSCVGGAAVLSTMLFLIFFKISLQHRSKVLILVALFTIAIATGIMAILSL